MSENPFEKWGIDPRGGPEAITRRMRDLIEDATDEDTKKSIRAAWEELTLHPKNRLHAALGAHPDSHGAAGAPPPPPPRQKAPPLALDVFDLLPRPRPSAHLGAPEPLPDLPPDIDPSLQ
ncbi:MAG: hypothetical protein AB8I08_23935 [Sandaracinaceae bacterium]